VAAASHVQHDRSIANISTMAAVPAFVELRSVVTRFAKWIDSVADSAGDAVASEAVPADANLLRTLYNLHFKFAPENIVNAEAKGKVRELSSDSYSIVFGYVVPPKPWLAQGRVIRKQRNLHHNFSHETFIYKVCFREIFSYILGSSADIL
jgi:hypothetical protein